MNRQPPSPQRQAYRLAVAAKVRVALWLLPERVGELRVPAKTELVSAAAHDLSPTGISIALHVSDFARLPIRLADRVGVLIESDDDRVICAADVRYIKEIPGDISRLGLAFNFDPADLSHRHFARKLEKVVASLERQMLRRRAYYGTPLSARA